MKLSDDDLKAVLIACIWGAAMCIVTLMKLG